MNRYKLVDDLYLDWILSCINRGKIHNMVGSSVTHTETTLIMVMCRCDKLMTDELMTC